MGSLASPLGTQEPPPPPPEMVPFSGYLIKAPARFRPGSKWRRRFFRLVNTQLFYLVREDSDRPKGIIDLRGCSIKAFRLKAGTPSAKRSKTPYQVRIHTRRLIYKLCAESEMDAREWCSAMVNNIECADVPPPPPPPQGGLRRVSMIDTNVGVTGQTEEEAARAARTYYAVLGVEPSSKFSIIRKEYYKLAKNFHPDKNPDADPKAFAEINKAFQTLKDPSLRREYDLCERIKTALRRGVLADVHGDDGTVMQVALVIDADHKNFFYQDASFGTVMREGYQKVEVRFIQEVAAGLDGFDEELEQVRCPEGKEGRMLTLLGAKLINGKKWGAVHIELDTDEARDEMLDGLRVLRCLHSVLFQQKLDKNLEDGKR